MSKYAAIIVVGALMALSCVSPAQYTGRIDPLFFQRLPERMDMLKTGMGLNDIERTLFLPTPLVFKHRFYSVTIYTCDLEDYSGRNGCAVTVEQNNQSGEISIVYSESERGSRITRNLGHPKGWKRIPL